MRGNDKYLWTPGQPLKRVSLMEWAEAFECDAHRRVGDDTVRTLFGDIRVSTVFLGLDHNWGEGPPIVFETMLFGGPWDEWQERYATEAEARAGHAAAITTAQQARYRLDWWLRHWWRKVR